MSLGVFGYVEEIFTCRTEFIAGKRVNSNLVAISEVF